MKTLATRLLILKLQQEFLKFNDYLRESDLSKNWLGDEFTNLENGSSENVSFPK